MAFSEFKNLAEVQIKYKIKYQEQNFILPLEISIPKTFLEDFEFYKKNLDIFTSEASRCEIIISPLLREIYKKHHQKYSFWIQKTITYNKTLSGTPDYIFSKKSELGKTVLEKPIVIIVEAKKNDFEQGWGQCLAELVASQKLNENPHKPIYGIVTDGNLWQFGKLVVDTFTQNIENFTIDKLSRLYGALEHMLQLVDSDSSSSE